MTLKEAISLGFKKHTLTTEKTGDSLVYHYFTLDSMELFLCIDEDEKNRGVWQFSIGPSGEFTTTNYSKAKRIIQALLSDEDSSN
jgi:hypothetical protein